MLTRATDLVAAGVLWALVPVERSDTLCQSAFLAGLLCCTLWTQVILLIGVMLNERRSLLWIWLLALTAGGSLAYEAEHCVVSILILLESSQGK